MIILFIVEIQFTMANTEKGGRNIQHHIIIE